MVESMEQFNEEELELETTTPDQGAAAPHSIQSSAERKAIIEALIFVSDEPLSARTIADVLKEDSEAMEAAVAELEQEFNARNGGLQLREVAGGWPVLTRPGTHEHMRAFLKSRPSAKLSLASLETL